MNFHHAHILIPRMCDCYFTDKTDSAGGMTIKDGDGAMILDYVGGLILIQELPGCGQRRET